MIKKVLFLSIVLILAACGNNNDKEEIPANIIDDHTFTAILIDVQLIEGMNSQVNYMRQNSTKERKNDPYLPIFEKYNVEVDDFTRTYEYYIQHPKKMELLYEQVLDSLSKLDVEIKQKYTQDERAKSDSIRMANQRRVDSIKGLPRLKKSLGK